MSLIDLMEKRAPRFWRIEAFDLHGRTHGHARAALGGRSGVVWPTPEARAQLKAAREEIARCKRTWHKAGHPETRFEGLELRLVEVPRDEA